MTIYELEKQATPGPWKRDTLTPFLYHGASVPQTKKSSRWVASYFMPNAGTRNLANAVLTVHCRNNFMKALAALKLWRSRAGELTLAQMEEYDQLITELEEVRSSERG